MQPQRKSSSWCNARSNKSYRDYLSVEEAGKELILYAFGDDAVAPLKKQYIGFGDTIVLQMIDYYASKQRSG
jgi:hypothetical protein